jgi:hypothetical protein
MVGTAGPAQIVGRSNRFRTGGLTCGPSRRMINPVEQGVREIRGPFEQLPVAKYLTTLQREKFASSPRCLRLTPRTFSKTKSANRTIVLGLNSRAPRREFNDTSAPAARLAPTSSWCRGLLFRHLNPPVAGLPPSRAGSRRVVSAARRYADATCTRRLPIASPFIIPMSADGAFSMPSTMSSWKTSSPLRSHGATRA